MSQMKTDWNEDLNFIRRTPGLVRNVVAGLEPQAQVRTPVSDFSLLEHVCHLRDIDAEGYAVRIQRLLKEVSPQLADLDGARLAVDRSYNDQDLQQALASFVENRARIIDLISNLTEAQKDRSGHLETVGEVTVKSLLNMMRVHDESHLEELAVLRRRILPTAANEF